MDHETRKSWRGKLGELVDGTKMGLSIMGLIVLDFIAVLGEVFIFLTEVTVCSYKCDGLKPIRLYDSKFKNGGLDLAHECSKDTSEMDAAQLARSTGTTPRSAAPSTTAATTSASAAASSPIRSG